MPILQTGRVRLSIIQLGRGGAEIDTQICLTLVPVSFPGRLPSSCRFLIYGRYCSQVESASKHLDRVATAREDVQMKLEVGDGLHLCGGKLSPFHCLGGSSGETELERASLPGAAQPGVCLLNVWRGRY